MRLNVRVVITFILLVKISFKYPALVNASTVLQIVAKEILTSKNKSYYDTNTKSHHHFYDEGSKELTDIRYSQIKLSKVPIPPKGKKIKNLEVVIRIQK